MCRPDIVGLDARSRRKLLKPVVFCIFVFGFAYSAYAEVFLLGDTTPIYYLTELDPRWEPVGANRRLFDRLIGPERHSVVLYTGQYWPGNATAELMAFFVETGRSGSEIHSLGPGLLTDGTVLVVGEPDWVWEADQIAEVLAFLRRGGRLLVVVEPKRCADTCIQSTNSLFDSIGSSLRLDDDDNDGPNLRGRWAVPTEHPLMNGVGHVRYGLTFGLGGGTALLLRRDRKAMLSVDLEN
jgi:hypothetical protein